MLPDLDPRKTRDALRLGLQSAVAASLCFIIIEAIGSDEAFVAVLSAVLIVQPSVGRTVSAGWQRFLATLFGSAVGLACLFLIPNGYGVAIVLAILMFVMNFIAGFKPDWRYGVVAVVALALADTSGNLDVAQARAIAIGIGIVVGICVCLIVWPESATKRGLRYRGQALDAISKRFSAALRDEDEEATGDEARRRFHEALTAGRDLADTSKGADADRLNATFDVVEELYNSVILIDRVDSPLSYFDGLGMDRSDLINRGQSAMECLANAKTDHASEAVDQFEASIDTLSGGLSDHDIGDDSGTEAASIIFGLKEMLRCMRSFREHEADARDRSDFGRALGETIGNVG